MTVEKEKLLKETYDKFIQISISDFQMEGMEKFIDQDIMGYGTTVDDTSMSNTDTTAGEEALSPFKIATAYSAGNGAAQDSYQGSATAAMEGTGGRNISVQILKQVVEKTFHFC